MQAQIQCPVCTLFLHVGMNLHVHLETHPKEQVIQALVNMTLTTQRDISESTETTQMQCSRYAPLIDDSSSLTSSAVSNPPTAEQNLGNNEPSNMEKCQPTNYQETSLRNNYLTPALLQQESTIPRQLPSQEPLQPLQSSSSSSSSSQVSSHHRQVMIVNTCRSTRLFREGTTEHQSSQRIITNHHIPIQNVPQPTTSAAQRPQTLQPPPTPPPPPPLSISSSLHIKAIEASPHSLVTQEQQQQQVPSLQSPPLHPLPTTQPPTQQKQQQQQQHHLLPATFTNSTNIDPPSHVYESKIYNLPPPPPYELPSHHQNSQHNKSLAVNFKNSTEQQTLLLHKINSHTTITDPIIPNDIATNLLSSTKHELTLNNEENEIIESDEGTFLVSSPQNNLYGDVTQEDDQHFIYDDDEIHEIPEEDNEDANEIQMEEDETNKIDGMELVRPSSVIQINDNHHNPPLMHHQPAQQQPQQQQQHQHSTTTSTSQSTTTNELIAMPQPIQMPLPMPLPIIMSKKKTTYGLQILSNVRLGPNNIFDKIIDSSSVSHRLSDTINLCQKSTSSSSQSILKKSQPAICLSSSSTSSSSSSSASTSAASSLSLSKTTSSMVTYENNDMIVFKTENNIENNKINKKSEQILKLDEQKNLDSFNEQIINIDTEFPPNEPIDITSDECDYDVSAAERSIIIRQEKSSTSTSTNSTTIAAATPTLPPKSIFPDTFVGVSKLSSSEIPAATSVIRLASPKKKQSHQQPTASSSSSSQTTPAPPPPSSEPSTSIGGRKTTSFVSSKRPMIKAPFGKNPKKLVVKFKKPFVPVIEEEANLLPPIINFPVVDDDDVPNILTTQDPQQQLNNPLSSLSNVNTEGEVFIEKQEIIEPLINHENNEINNYNDDFPFSPFRQTFTPVPNYVIGFNSPDRNIESTSAAVDAGGYDDNDNYPKNPEGITKIEKTEDNQFNLISYNLPNSIENVCTENYEKSSLDNCSGDSVVVNEHVIDENGEDMIDIKLNISNEMNAVSATKIKIQSNESLMKRDSITIVTCERGYEPPSLLPPPRPTSSLPSTSSHHEPMQIEPTSLILSSANIEINSNYIDTVPVAVANSTITTITSAATTTATSTITKTIETAHNQLDTKENIILTADSSNKIIDNSASTTIDNKEHIVLHVDAFSALASTSTSSLSLSSSSSSSSSSALSHPTTIVSSSHGGGSSNSYVATPGPSRLDYGLSSFLGYNDPATDGDDFYSSFPQDNYAWNQRFSPQYATFDGGEKNSYTDLDTCKNTTTNSFGERAASTDSLNIRTDEKMPAKGEISEQESNGDIDGSWSHQIYPLQDNLPRYTSSYDTTVARESWSLSNDQNHSHNHHHQHNTENNISMVLPKFTPLQTEITYQLPTANSVAIDVKPTREELLAEKAKQMKPIRKYRCPECPKVFSILKEKRAHLIIEHNYEPKPLRAKLPLKRISSTITSTCISANGLSELDQAAASTSGGYGTNLLSAQLIPSTSTELVSVKLETLPSRESPSKMNKFLMDYNWNVLRQQLASQARGEEITLPILPTEGNTHLCMVCHERFNSVKKFDAHMSVHAAECYTCGRLFRHWINLIVHLKRHLNIREYECIHCNKKFVLRQNLLEHMNTHSGDTPLQCKICNKRFRRSSNLIQHRNRHHLRIRPKEKDYICACGEVFHSEAKMAWHRETHDKKPKCCPYCRERFTHRNSLSRHIRLSHTDRFSLFKSETVECTICNKTYMKSSLKAHMASHTSKVEYGCTICNKGFTTKWNLKQHKWIHASRSSKPFKCTICPKAFIREADFISHTNTHKSIKPYTCNHCGRQFARKYNWLRHTREHEKPKGFRCDDCGKVFHRAYYLTEHRRSHTGERPFECIICGKTSTTKTNHNKHVKIHHARDPLTAEG